MILREFISHDGSMLSYFKNLPGLYFDAAAAMNAQVDAERHVAMRVNLFMNNLWLLIVQPRHFLLVMNDAAYQAVNWAGFTGIPFFLGFLDFLDIWVMVGLVFWAVTYVAEEHLRLGALLWRIPEGKGLSDLKLPRYRDCKNITAWMESFQLSLTMDDGTFSGTYVNPTVDQQEYAIQRTHIWQGVMTALAAVAAGLPPDYMYDISLARLKGMTTVVRQAEMTHVAASQWTSISQNMVL